MVARFETAFGSRMMAQIWTVFYRHGNGSNLDVDGDSDLDLDSGSRPSKVVVEICPIGC